VALPRASARSVYGHTLVRAVCAFAAVAAVSACGGGISERERVEHALARGGKAICDGDCQTYHATGATCERVRETPRRYRCRVEYDNGGPADRICVAVEGSDVKARPLRECVAE
jgi:hypothetical protein